MYNFKSKDSEILIWKYEIIWKKLDLHGYVYDFSVDYDSIVVDDIKNIE